MRNRPLGRTLENLVSVLIAMRLSLGIIAAPDDVDAMRKNYNPEINETNLNYNAVVLDSVKSKPRIKLSDKIHEKVKVRTIRSRKRVIDRKYGRIIKKAASRNNLPYDLVVELIYRESSGNRYAVSEKNAKGLMQLMPLTGKEYRIRNFFDPEQNIYAGTEYLADLVKKYDGDIKAALTGYNWNPNKVERLIRENGRYWWDSHHIPSKTRKFVEELVEYSDN